MLCCAVTMGKEKSYPLDTHKENCNTIVLQGDDFMAMDATLQIRIDSAVKEQVEALYRNLGTSFAEAVRMFAQQSL